ncbi:MAG TPA: RidA family protein [Bryobacteraceae bacterium]|nr:RidA family protein [Bryobacteraceae bacterium]
MSYDAFMSNRVLKTLCVSLVLAFCAAAADQPANKKVITPKDTPPGRPFSQGILVGDTLYVSGQGGADASTKKIPDKFEDEVRSCLKNVASVLQAGGMDLPDVVSVQVYLTDISMFQRMNAVYMEMFKEPRPTRTTVEVSKLAAPGAHIEITVIARK